MRHTKLEIGIQLFVQMLCLVIIVIGLTKPPSTSVRLVVSARSGGKYFRLNALAYICSDSGRFGNNGSVRAGSTCKMICEKLGIVG